MLGLSAIAQLPLSSIPAIIVDVITGIKPHKRIINIKHYNRSLDIQRIDVVSVKFQNRIIQVQ